MKCKLAHRARRIYRNEVFVSSIKKSVRFVPRYIQHVLGTKGLYGSPHYRSLLCWWNARPYSVDDPFRIVHLNPNEITHVTGRGPNPGRFQWQDLGTIQGGDWDRNEERVKDLPVVQALRQRFKNNMDWEDIGFIQHVLRQAERGNVIWRGCTNKDDIWDACARVDDLYESIRDHGYRSKRELVSEGPQSPDKYVERDGFRKYDEVAVDIGRDGEFLFVDGRHRLTIADILDVDEIPVRIAARHKEWQSIRESFTHVQTVETIPERLKCYVHHIDLDDLIGERTE